MADLIPLKWPLHECDIEESTTQCGDGFIVTHIGHADEFGIFYPQHAESYPFVKAEYDRRAVKQ